MSIFRNKKIILPFFIIFFILFSFSFANKAHAAEWTGNISVSNLLVNTGISAAHVTIQINFNVTSPSANGSWAAVEESTTGAGSDGNVRLVPSGTSGSGRCGAGGLCIEVATDKNFTANIKTYALEPRINLASQTVQIHATSLQENTKYYYRFIGEETGSDEHYFPFNGDDSNPNITSVVSEAFSFTTNYNLSTTFSVATKPAINITKFGATMIGEVINSGTVWFKLGLSETALDDKTPDQSMSVDGDFQKPIEKYKAQDMVEGTTYYYKACAKNTTNTETCGETTESFIPKYLQTVFLTPTQRLPPETTYYPLAPLPGVGKMDCTKIKDMYGVDTTNCIDTAPSETNSCPFGNYLNMLIKIFIGLCAVLAFIMIVMGGIEYMTSELVSGKANGKERIMGAILGLLLALGAYTLLNTLNPQLLEICLGNMPKATVMIQDEPEHGIQEDTITLIKKEGGTVTLTNCDETQMENVSVFGKSVQVYKGLKNSLTRINTKWLAIPVANRYVVNKIGGYNCREVTNKPGYWSAHAFGLALDINQDTNPYGNTRVTDMPDNFVKLFTDEDWGWGGNWSAPIDAMHFSKYPESEGGDTVVELTNTN